MTTLTKKTIMSRISKYPSIIDITIVPMKENTTITYICGHTSVGRLENLIYKGNNSFCKLCNPKNLKKTNSQFLEEVKKISTDIVFLEEYRGNHEVISFTYISCGHINKVSPNSLLRQNTGSICRVCYPLKTTNQKFISKVAELNPDIELMESFVNTKTNISFKYKSCGHINNVRADILINSAIPSICRVCNPIRSQYKKTHEQFLKEVHAINSDIVILEKYYSNRIGIKLRYSTCGHECRVTPSNLLSKGQNIICRTCNPLLTSKGEREITELLSKYTAVETSNRSILEGLEIDIYLPEFKIGIEYNGEYWHSDKHKNKDYHLSKTNIAKGKGIRLIHIFEHEWLQKQDIVKSRLLGMLQQNYKLGARKCIVKELAFNEVKDFLNENHLQGSGSPSKYNLGLLYNDLLVAVMTFSKPRFNSNYDYELIRYASLTGVNIQGGASKLLKYFTSKYQGSIISYSDKRWSDGNLYKTLGFKYSHSSEPSYFYAKNSTILSRYQCQKHKLKDLVSDIYKDELSESDIMANAGFNKVYDCGTDVWILKE